MLSWLFGQGWSGEAADAFETSIGESMLATWDEWKAGASVIREEGIGGSRELLVNDMAERYAAIAVNQGEGMMYAVAANDVTGGTPLLESGFGVDIADQRTLTTDERWQRGLFGGGQVLLSAVGSASAVNSARAGYSGVGLRSPPIRGTAGTTTPGGPLVGGQTWGNVKTLAKHFADHGRDFGARSASDYARLASDFLRQGMKNRLPTKIAKDGTIRVYDPKTNTFGAYNADGTAKTFFKPAPKSASNPRGYDPAECSSPSEYWSKQEGVSPWEPK